MNRYKQLLWFWTATFVAQILLGCSGATRSAREEAPCIQDNAEGSPAVQETREEQFAEWASKKENIEALEAQWREIEPASRYIIENYFFDDGKPKNALVGADYEKPAGNFLIVRAKENHIEELAESGIDVEAEEACAELYWMEITQKSIEPPRYYFCKTKDEYSMISAYQHNGCIWRKMK